jgi:hypothetical protein
VNMPQTLFSLYLQHILYESCDKLSRTAGSSALSMLFQIIASLLYKHCLLTTTTLSPDDPSLVSLIEPSMFLVCSRPRLVSDMLSARDGASVTGSGAEVRHVMKLRRSPARPLRKSQARRSRVHRYKAAESKKISYVGER